MVKDLSKRKVGRCPGTEIIRKGYYRKGYYRTSPSGKRIHIKSVYVKPKCVRDLVTPPKKKPRVPKSMEFLSMPKNVQITIFNKGKLTDYGYSSKLPTTVRRNALKKSIKIFGSLSVYRKLIAVKVLNKNTNPTISKKFGSDANWIKKNYEFF